MPYPPIWEHTQSGLVACGGGESETTKICQTFSSGHWEKTHTLLKSRNLHIAWSSPFGTLLMGGSLCSGQLPSCKTTEVINDFGESRAGFELTHKINSGCAIHMEEKFIITGGVGSSGSVYAYNMQGLIKEEKYPNLLSGTRYYHGCGHYFNNDNILVYLVTGGYNWIPVTLSSTEIFFSGGNSWIEVKELPLPMYGLSGISIHNQVIMTGGVEKYGLLKTKSTNKVFSFDITSEQWIHIGNMTGERCKHGISLVPVEEIAEYCKS